MDDRHRAVIKQSWSREPYDNAKWFIVGRYVEGGHVFLPNVYEHQYKADATEHARNLNKKTTATIHWEVIARQVYLLLIKEALFPGSTGVNPLITELFKNGEPNVTDQPLQIEDRNAPFWGVFAYDDPERQNSGNNLGGTLHRAPTEDAARKLIEQKLTRYPAGVYLLLKPMFVARLPINVRYEAVGESAETPSSAEAATEAQPS